MGPGHKILIFAILALLGTPARAQLKNMPTQAEFDPILENADAKVKDFLATLTKYRAEANEIDNERLTKDIHDFSELRQVIELAHSGSGNHGINLVRIYGIVTSLDDATIEADVWSNMVSLRVCRPHTQAILYFALAVQNNAETLREVSGELFHPAFRLMGAADQIMAAWSEAGEKNDAKPQ